MSIDLSAPLGLVVYGFALGGLYVAARWVFGVTHDAISERRYRRRVGSYWTDD